MDVRFLNFLTVCLFDRKAFIEEGYLLRMQARKMHLFLCQYLDFLGGEGQLFEGAPIPGGHVSLLMHNPARCLQSSEPATFSCKTI